jgi:hypothetical protein
MSNYTDFIVDFPRRCRDILLFTHEQALAVDREVTLMLVIASAGLLVPYERLKTDGIFVHPAGDDQKYTKAADELKQMLKQSFIDSPLWNSHMTSWSSGELDSAAGDPQDWPELQNVAPIPATQRVSNVLSVIRNALAHGNLYTKADYQLQIEALVFVSGGYNKKNKQMIPYKYVFVSPSDFRQFLLNWFQFLEGLSIPQGDLLEVVEEAISD